MKYKLGILGFGVMGQGILLQILEKGLLKSEEVTVYDLEKNKISAFPYAIVGADTIQNLIDSSENVLLAVKPQTFPDICKTADFSRLCGLLSIMAGIKLSTLRQQTICNGAIARIMPNTPCAVGKGVCAIAFDGEKNGFSEMILQWLSACGDTVVIEEEKFDAVTSVSGSGPAYVYMFADALIQGGINGGLSYAESKKLALATIQGAAELASRSDENLSVLTDRVCSKGGTTIEAVNVFRKEGLQGTIQKGVEACRKRSSDLSGDK